MPDILAICQKRYTVTGNCSHIVGVLTSLNWLGTPDRIVYYAHAVLYLGGYSVLCWPRDSKPATQDVYSLASRPYVVVASQHDMVWYASLAGLAERIEGAVEGATLFRSGKVGLQMLACSCYAVCADGCVASNIELM